MNARVPDMLRFVLLCFIAMTLLAICLISKGPKPRIAAENIEELVLIDEIL